MKAMIFAAGLGRRLRPITDSKPKALAELNGAPLLEITIKRLIHFGFDHIIINVHHFSSLIIDFLRKNNNFGISISISDESDLLLDTGGGLKKAAHFFDNNHPFLVHNVDVVSNIDLISLFKAHLTHNNLATIAVMERESSRQFLVNAQNELCGWKNNKTHELKIARETDNFLKPVSFCGIHIISHELLSLINETGIFSITDLYLRLASKHIIKTIPYNNAIWFDLGTPENLEKACGFKKELGI
jgi:NDP-sugar pyrophosphorylase family protein